MKLSPCLKHYLENFPMLEKEIKEAQEALDEAIQYALRSVAMGNGTGCTPEEVIKMGLLARHITLRTHEIHRENMDEHLRRYQAKVAMQAFELDESIKALEALDEEVEITDSMIALQLVRTTYLKHVH